MLAEECSDLPRALRAHIRHVSATGPLGKQTTMPSVLSLGVFSDVSPSVPQACYALCISLHGIAG
eukprot:13891762-Alexandrium_andersonii.AAC.1